MPNVNPDTSFETTADGYPTGLTGTIGVRLTDNQGTTTIARTTSDITEYPAGTGIYTTTLLSPSVAGQYTIIWDDGTNYATDDLNVTYSAFSPEPSGPTYATVNELAGLLKVNATTFVTSLTRVLVIATGEIDNDIGRGDDDPISGWELSLAAQVCIERAFEHWHQMRSAFGIVTLAEGTGQIWTPRDSWDRHSKKLAPLKATWGIA